MMVYSIALWAKSLVVASTVNAAAPAQGSCAEPVVIYADGQVAGQVCPEEAAAQGLTLIDLRDTWMPRALLGDATQTQANAYRETWEKLALGDTEIGSHSREARHDRYFEAFGIPPAFTQVRDRLANETLHACHAAVETSELKSFLSGPKRDQEHFSAEALRALQHHLLCEGLIVKGDITGTFAPKTRTALGIYRRKHLLLSTRETDKETIGALLESNLELDFYAGLRSLRERVVDATGLIEDGSAALSFGTVLGRSIQPATWHQARGWTAASRAAPDLISPATEAAARALGWVSPQAMLAFLQRETLSVVALRLPPPPSYASEHMELRVEIDRGTHGPPHTQTPSASRRIDPNARRPTMTLWAKDGDHEIALMRWPTTVGGWKRDRTKSGKIFWKFKESPTGDFVWRDLVAAPVWYPPASTPDAELLHQENSGRFRLRDSLIGPGYRSAYGLVMFVEHQVIQRKDREYWIDTLVRSHGSVDYRSLINGTSHGCHRLYNHLALRLSGFMLKHRRWEQVGPLREVYSRSFTHNGKTYGIFRGSQGDAYRMVPPIPVHVGDGLLDRNHPEALAKRDESGENSSEK
jgi:hypothetical protein